LTHPELSVILGPPGTGKTTALLSIMQQELEAGVHPQNIAFLAFTKKAASEATERACKRFSFAPSELPYYRTIHSLCFRRLGLRPDGVMSSKHYRELGDRLGLDLKGSRGLDDELYGMDAGDRMLFLEGLARVSDRPLARVYDDADEPDISYGQLDQLARALERYKVQRGLVDYTDMLQRFTAQAARTVPPLDALIVDEAQDLSALQWRAVDAVAQRARRVYIAGDDDQAIYRWAGADVDAFMALRGSIRVLGQSYRIPGSVHTVADRIVQQIGTRTPKTWTPRKEPGSVRYATDPEEIDMGPGTGSWLLLARNGYMLDELEAICRVRGYSYESVGRDNPLNGQALRAVIAYTRLCRGVESKKEDVEAVLKFISVATVDQRVRKALRKHPADQPVTIGLMQEWGFPSNPPIWHHMLDRVNDADRAYFIAARKQGETLTGTPRIRISTIHAAKGGEADNVLLLTDMSSRTRLEMDRKADDECRVWYVGVTRARNTLYLLQPRTGNCFDL